MDTVHALDKDNERVVKTPRVNLIAYSREQEELMAELQRQLNTHIQTNLLQRQILFEKKTGTLRLLRHLAESFYRFTDGLQNG